jgi:hypothetical protein
MKKKLGFYALVGNVDPGEEVKRLSYLRVAAIQAATQTNKPLEILL